MIVVIADDLTGAAELGGIGLRYGLVTEISTMAELTSNADMLVVSTDTRSMPQGEAVWVTDQVCAVVNKMNPSLVYKKTDSVLRGHVLAEIRVQQERMRLPKALILPANPRLNRQIINGLYLLNGLPVHLSSFSQDPEFPVLSSGVAQMLKAREDEITILGKDDKLPAEGICVGEVETSADLAHWCSRIDDLTLLAGAAEFFTALLESRHIKPLQQPVKATGIKSPVLMVCGSTFAKSALHVAGLQQKGVPVMFMSRPIIEDMNGIDARTWINEAARSLAGSGRLVITIDPALKDASVDALLVRTSMAEAVFHISSRVRINEYLLEGGSTAAAILKKLDIKSLRPVQELSPGVIRMNVPGDAGLFFTVKPGSYDWPPNLL